MSVRVLAVLAVVMMPAVMAPAQTEWVLYEGNPLVPGPEADEWPSLYRWIEAVIVVDGTYHMFFTGTRIAFTIDHEIGHATSSDGITWTMDPRNSVITPKAEGGWVVDSFYSLAVVHDGNEFLMWYGGQDPDGHCQVGLATSPDGSVWTRYAGNPVIENGPEGSLDAGLVEPGTVLRRGRLFHMWYGAVEAPSAFDPHTIAYATSVDGVSWIRHPTPLLEPNPSSDWEPNLYGPAVMFDGATYHMWYTGLTEDLSEVQVGYATSPDGLSWTKDPGNPIEELEEPGGAAEQAQVLLHADSNECEMFYNVPTVYRQPIFKVNRATSTCQSYRLRTRRVSGMRIPVREGRAAVPSKPR
jgi:sucrose-6-phosphate hydrolase SacC (GH32 family)